MQNCECNWTQWKSNHRRTTKEMNKTTAMGITESEITGSKTTRYANSPVQWLCLRSGGAAAWRQRWHRSCQLGVIVICLYACSGGLNVVSLADHDDGRQTALRTGQLSFSGALLIESLVLSFSLFHSFTTSLTQHPPPSWRGRAVQHTEHNNNKQHLLSDAIVSCE